MLAPFAYASFPSSKAVSKRCIPQPVFLPIPPSTPVTAPLPSPQPSGASRPAPARPGGGGEPCGMAEHRLFAPLGPLQGEQLPKPEPAGVARVPSDAAQHFQAPHLCSQGAAMLHFTGVLKALAHWERTFRLLHRFSCYLQKKAKTELFSFIITWIVRDEK